MADVTDREAACAWILRFVPKAPVTGPAGLVVGIPKLDATERLAEFRATARAEADAAGYRRGMERAAGICGEQIKEHEEAFKRACSAAGRGNPAEAAARELGARWCRDSIRAAAQEGNDADRR